MESPEWKEDGIQVGSEPAGTWTHSLKQWAADTSHLALMMAAPQKCSLFWTYTDHVPGHALITWLIMH